ncbi:MAG: hypothetical protein AAB361_03610 [Patescibacteria group bacterium]
MKKILSLLLVLSGVLILPNIAFAQVTIVGMVINVTSVIVVVATALVVIFWMITGLLFLSAQGAPDRLNLAKKALFASIAGTALVILAQAAQTIIGNALFLGV